MRASVAAWLSTAAVAATVGGIVALPSLLAADSGGNGATDHNRPAAATDPVVRNGDTVTGTGRVVAVAGQPVRFCAPVAVAAPGYASGVEPPISSCPTFGVEVSGVSLAGLGRRHHRGAAVEGYATLTGTYRDGILTVSRQSAHMGPRPYPALDQVPCPPPSGGWPRDGADLDPGFAQAYSAAHPDEIVDISLRHPTATQVVLAAAARDPVRTRAALRPAYGERLCVIRALYTGKQVNDARQRLSAVAVSGVAYAAGVQSSPNGQPQMAVEVLMHTATLVGIVREFPPSLVRIDSWLTKVR